MFGKKELPELITNKTQNAYKFELFRTECIAIIREYNFDENTIIKLVDEMISETKTQNSEFPEANILKAAYTSVFNSVALELMTQKYKKDRSLFLSARGEQMLDGLNSLSLKMVQLQFWTKTERDDIFSNAVSKIHQIE